MIDQLQFIRADWLYAFIPLAVFILLMVRRHGSSMSWKAVCDAQLLPYILTKTTGKTSRFPLILVAVATSLCIIAAAGPVFKKLPQPVFREQSALVVIMDLSQSMDAIDLRPSRIERAKLKLLDILKSRKGGQTALIVYAANAFVVTPLTDDTNTIASLVPTLKTGLMPTQGSRAHIAIDKAAELLQQAGANNGDALLITDGLSSKDYEAINAFSAQGHRLSILGIGTTEGGPVPLNGGFLQDANGAIVIPKLNLQQLRQAALKGGGMYVSLQADDSDINRLDKLFTSNKIKSESMTPTLGELELTADIWQEEGPWLLLLVIPIAALWSRKGWLLSAPVIALSLSLSIPEPAYALDMANLWRTSDQKAMRAFKSGDTKRAAEEFEDNRWKSSAHYRAGDYEKSLEALAEPVSSDDFYNKGNALSQLGRFPEAVKAYDEAIKLDANNKDASYNRELVKKEMQKQQNDQQQDGQPQNDQPKDDQPQDDQDQNEQSKDEQSQDNQSGDEKSQDKQSENDNQGDQQQDQQQSSEEPNQSEQNQSEQNQQKDNETKQNNAQQEQAQTSDEPASSEQSNEDDVKQALKDAQQQEQDSERENADDKQNDESLALSEKEVREEITEDDHATEQWLKRIPDDPGQLLRNKFYYQYKRMPNQTTDEQPW